MLIKSFNIDINIDTTNELSYNDILDIIVKKMDISNKNSITLICNNNIINNNNLNEYINKDVYLYIDKNKNTNDIYNVISELFNLNLLNINVNNYQNNLNILTDMGYDIEISINALENNNNDIIDTIEYLLEN